MVVFPSIYCISVHRTRIGNWMIGIGLRFTTPRRQATIGAHSFLAEPAMRSSCAAVLLLSVTFPAVAGDGNRLAYLQDNDPYYVHAKFPKLITPQWIGEPGVEAVIVLAIDDMK